MKDLESVYSHVKILTIALFIGIILKSIISYLYIGIVSFDAMNVLLLNIFTIIKIYTNKTVIYHA